MFAQHQIMQIHENKTRPNMSIQNEIITGEENEGKM